MDILLDEKSLIWTVALSLTAVYLIAAYVHLRYCERRAEEYGRLILQTYGRDMSTVPESVLQYYRQDVAAYRRARRWYPFAFLRPAAVLLQVPNAKRGAGGRFEKCRRPVLSIGRPAAGLKRYWHAGIMKFEEASDDDLWYEKDWDRHHYDEYMRLINEK